jgi:hypothetical protein
MLTGSSTPKTKGVLEGGKKIFESKLKRRELLILEYDNLPLCIKYTFEVLVWLLQAV